LRRELETELPGDDEDDDPDDADESGVEAGD
jgi:hypothetical protein